MQGKQPKNNKFILPNRQIDKNEKRKTKGKHSTYTSPQNQNKSSELDLLMTRGNAYTTIKISRNWEIIFILRTNKWDHCFITAHLNIRAKLIKRKHLHPKHQRQIRTTNNSGKI